ncbi:hypothetical protein [Actinokineospora spheciospongiae]|uniref:hypothetical protein n=1 Tax=Actinokineospora spheciospongiae TaxID=909613 RepID=UPI000D8323A6|nr:hypothetical protein [Actinokineospora spheciospongiae]PWW60251.1 hypothetical protein DFQ13_10747 [Actinokineospora spheciospongiae]
MGEISGCGDRLTVDVVAYPAALKQVDVDPARFLGRSSVDAEAVVVLRVETRVDPQVFARADPGVAVFALEPGQTLDDVLACDESWPIVIAPPLKR